MLTESGDIYVFETNVRVDFPQVDIEIIRVIDTKARLVLAQRTEIKD